jgi:hypothetical protein
MVMIVAEHQHSEAYANAAKCILSGCKHLLGMSINPELLKGARIYRLLILQHYSLQNCDQNNCTNFKNILR